MRKQFLSATTIIAFSLIFFYSCKKQDQMVAPPSNNYTPTIPIVAVVQHNKEYFWANYWTTTSRGQEIFLNTDNLTQDAINKGITVKVALWTEMTTFENIPATLYNIPISYTVKPGELNIIALITTPINYASDVYIEYQ